MNLSTFLSKHHAMKMYGD